MSWMDLLQPELRLQRLWRAGHPLRPREEPLRPTEEPLRPQAERRPVERFERRGIDPGST